MKTEVKGQNPTFNAALDIYLMQMLFEKIWKNGREENWEKE